jgi:hypothetical protein
MNEDHTRLLAEFRVLADSVLARVEPMLAQLAEGRASGPEDGQNPAELPAFGGCSWCPVCAIAALVRGEHHELLAFLAGQAAVLLALLRELLDEFLGGHNGPDSGPDGGASAADDSAKAEPRASAFVPITVTVKP